MLKKAGKLAPEAKPRVVNLLFQAFFVYSRVAYTIFPHIIPSAKSGTFVKTAGRECATFAWGMRKILFFSTLILQFSGVFLCNVVF